MKKILIVVLTVLDVFVFAVFALINLNGTYKDNQKKIADNRQKTEQIKAKTDSLSVQNYMDALAKRVGTFNLADEKRETGEKLADGVRTAYTVQGKKEYDTDKIKVRKELGDLLADKVLSDTEPTASQAGDGTPVAERVNDVKVSFGSYDSDKNTIQTLIMVDYDVPGDTIMNGNVNRKGYYWGTYSFSDRGFTNVAYQITGKDAK